MRLSLHIQRLVIDEALLTRADRDGLAEAIEHELHHQLQGPSARHEPHGRQASPAPVPGRALGESILARLPPGAGPPPPTGGSAR
jgi:hypothetical protein